ncbi:MAG: UvrD-helicase domain-containing protein, partial [Bacteroidota bacterium]
MSGLTIYRSSAGSGKTYTLVKEYLLIALQFPLQFSRILAITFTNKATAEMKSRIITALDDLAHDRKKTLKEELQQQLPATIDVTEQAKLVLTNILHHYSNFSISTIDSFFNEIVKSLAHELRLSLRFEIELDTDKILSTALDTLLAQAGSDKQLTEWLEEFLLFQIDNDKGWSIRDGLIKVARKLFDEEYDIASFLPDTNQFKEIISSLKKIKSAFETDMHSFGELFLNALAKSSYSIEDFSYGNKGVGAYFKKIADKNKRAIEYKPNSYATNAMADADKWLTKQKQSDSVLKNLIDSELFPIATATAEYLNEHKKYYYSAAEALKRIYIIGILSRLNEEVKKYRDEYNVITLNDANKIVRDSVTSSDAPLIFEKTGSFFQHYLVDEFQDTSTVQWNNIRPLVSEALANNKSALLVGDIKQSIYRWRGGNMELLHAVAEKQLSAQQHTISSKILDTNFRSTKEIIDFNNRFFSLASEWVMNNCPGNLTIVKEAYAELQLHQKVPGTAPENGYIKIASYEKGEGETSDSDLHWKKRSLADMVITINKLYEKGFSAGDITILVRSNFQGNMVASFLYENGIQNIISADSLLIHTAPQIIFLVNCLTLLSNPDNILIKKEMEWFLFLQQHPDEKINHSVFTTEIKSSEITQKITAFLKEFESASVMPVDDLVSLLIRYFHLDKKPDAYIQRFQDLVAEFRDKNPADKNSFLKWWEDDSAASNCSIIMPESQSAIRIMTIHKSKGLQFPVVILPFADWDLIPKGGEILWARPENIAPFNQLDFWPVSSSEKLEETVFSESYAESINNSYTDNLNLLYVALTRAVNHLYISIIKKDDDGKSKSVSSLIAAVVQDMNMLQEENF